MHNVLKALGNIGIVPVIKIDDAAKAIPLAKALIVGGIPCAEVTFRTQAGEEAIRLINKEAPNILLGAGTVLSVEQVDRAISAGAKFIVSPGFNPKVVSYCIKKGIPVIPGCSNPSDVERALELELEVVKFFPAEQAGGLDYIKAIAAPYPKLKFMPTGGINALNIAKYIAYEKILACGGSWMVSAELINTGDVDRIMASCRDAMLTMLGLSVVHLGVNTSNADEAAKVAWLFNTLFGFTTKNGISSIFASDSIEIMKSPGLGKHGHIGISTNTLPRAIAYFERVGAVFDSSSAKNDATGKMTAIYFKDEIAGFAVHLVQKKIRG
ncbi:MAG: bifunctional 4-hydroxy-2-oxoglutarate aldolase/2-dehydro-3-deoxy-phosphogluconate aldolase [Treponema sp.]|jgi:2-dehydro-3-deoxyphosphogluconate aldolase/(4S)-4-hydroxy-2-oxoglutarate aldolase|nr:bifunctional 4-hydroxy-2-oxoglutarate aldolase/2-dehydro-3-deoxy-phosphogluconate aldolase [Treponema sp.]